MKAAANTLAVVSLALVSAACGARQPQGEGPAEPRPGLQITIEVENQNFYDARIYLVLFGERTRLGQVSSHSTRVFAFAAGPDEVRIEVSFIGGGGFVTEPMAVTAGDQLQLVITPAGRRFIKR